MSDCIKDDVRFCQILVSHSGKKKIVAVYANDGVDGGGRPQDERKIEKNIILISQPNICIQAPKKIYLS